MELYGKRTRAEDYMGSEKNAHEHDAIQTRWYDWIRSARRRNTAVTADNLKAGSRSNRGILMDQTIMIERIPFQGFNRKLENWASFRRVFREMVKVSR